MEINKSKVLVFILCLLFLLLIYSLPSMLTANYIEEKEIYNTEKEFKPDIKVPNIEPLNNSTITPVLLIKVPKTGGTTLAVTLQRYARLYDLKVGNPGSEALVNTCQGSSSSKVSAWESFMRRNGGTIDIFATHSCFSYFMQDSDYWSTKDKNFKSRPLTLSLLREPWSRFVSSYRYTRKCCELMSKRKSWCKSKCDWNTLPVFIENYCARQSCNIAHHFLSGNRGLKRFDLVLTIERFDEGLVLLHILYKIPWIVLPYLTANENNDIPMPKYTEEFKQASLKKYMSKDVELYKEVNRLLDMKIENLSPENKKLFNEKLILLREQSKKAQQDCKYRRGDDCLDGGHAPNLKHAAGCYYKCVEASINGEPLPAVPICKRNECKRFSQGCNVCECSDDNETATCKENFDACNFKNPACIS